MTIKTNKNYDLNNIKTELNVAMDLQIRAPYQDFKRLKLFLIYDFVSFRKVINICTQRNSNVSLYSGGP